MFAAPTLESTAIDLEECVEFRQALRARTPRLVHATASVLTMLVAAAIAWLSLTEASLVVHVNGRMRPAHPNGQAAESPTEVIRCGVEGRIEAVAIREGELIAEGDLLLRIDPTRIKNRIRKTEAAVAATKAELANLDAYAAAITRQAVLGQQHAEAELAAEEEQVATQRLQRATAIRLAELELTEATEQHHRAARLSASKAIAQETLQAAQKRQQQALTKLKLASVAVRSKRLAVFQQALSAAQHQREVKRRELAVERSARHGELRAAQFELENMRLDLAETEIRAPRDGRVISLKVRVGDLVSPGTAGLRAAWRQEMEFEGLVSNDKVGRLEVGMPCRVKLDAYDYQSYGTLAATLRSVAPDSELPASQAGRGSGGAMYRVKLDISQTTLGRGTDQAVAKLGMTGEAEIVLDQETLLQIFLKKMRGTISLNYHSLSTTGVIVSAIFSTSDTADSAPVRC